MKRKEWIIVAIVVLASASYLIFRSGGDRIGYRLPEWEGISRDTLQEIEYGGTSSTVRIVKNGDIWLLEGGQKTDPTKMDQLLSALEEMVLLDLVSEVESYRRFELDDSQATSVTLVSEGERREFLFGKSASTSGATYVRFPGEVEVYTLKGRFETLLPEDAAELRDKTVLAFDPASITSATLSSGAYSLTLQLEEGAWVNNGEAFAFGAEWEALLAQLNGLKCSSFISDIAEGEPEASLILEGQMSYSLSVFSKDGESFPAISSGTEDPFLLPAYQVEGLLNLISQ